MSTEIVADKYSSAMLELAQEQGNLVTTEDNLLYVASVLNEQPELVGFIIILLWKQMQRFLYLKKSLALL